VAHVRAVADATDLPVMLYDIPGRTGVAFATETLVELAAHPRVVAVKDAKDDVAAAADAIARTGLAWYSGTDALNLPLLSVGAVGCVSVIGHLVAGRLRALADAYAAGDVDRARDLNAALGPLAVGLFRTQGVILTKAALGLLGAGVGGVRLPLVDATEEQLRVLRQDLSDGGVALP
jgi:4-hydroxy-tetrahydrodipicolinate synthase